MTKAHMKISEEPLIPGQDQEAICGAIVKKAEFVMYIDRSLAGHCEVNSFHFCRACWTQPTHGKRYLYGLVDGAEAKQEESVA